uniref:Phospholipase A2 n=1 Tax=Corethrella appendiculata TaxID=1370023 RepID=U5EP92_9DIPT
MIFSRKTTKRLKKLTIVLLGAILTILTTTTKAKPTISFQLPSAFTQSLSQYVEKKYSDAMKDYSGKRFDESSLRMIYFHDQTIAVVELGPDKLLISCELIEIYNDKDGKKLLNKLARINHPLEISFSEMIKLMSQCEQIERFNDYRNFNGDNDRFDDADYQNDQPNYVQAPKGDTNNNKNALFQTNPLSLLSGIIPGTKWCGTGDIAKGYHDLGTDPKMDRCCRTHDLCPLKVRPYQKRYKLDNQSIYTKSHCICDDMLYSCLKATNTSASQLMGSIYFNLVQVPCLEGDPLNGLHFRKAREGF